MEFLLQLFANMIGDPDEEQVEIREKIAKNEDESRAYYAVEERIEEEEPVLFGLMQFH